MSLRGIVLGLALLAASAGLYFVAGFGRTEAPWSVVAPLSGASNLTASQSFQVQEVATYRASIEVDRNFTYEHAGCLLGVPNSPGAAAEDCPSAAPEITISVLSDGKILRPTQVFPGGLSGVTDAFAQDVAVYPLRPGPTYVVEARISEAQPELKAAHPRVVIALDPMEIMNALGRNALSFLGSSILALFGAGILLQSIFGQLRRP